MVEYGSAQRELQERELRPATSMQKRAILSSTKPTRKPASSRIAAFRMQIAARKSDAAAV